MENISQQIRECARRWPDKTALVCEGRTLSYAGLADQIDRMAGWLLARGLKPGDRVAIHMLNSIEAVVACLACFRAGLVAAPINVRLKAAEVEYILGHCGATVYIGQRELFEPLREATGGCDTVQVEWPDLPSEAAPLPRVEGNAPAVLLYTSGTTAHPKGVLHTQASLWASARMMHELGMSWEDRVIVMTSIAHASGLTCLTIPALTLGATAVMLPVFDPDRVLDAIESNGGSYVVALPAMLQMVLAAQEERPRNVASLRTVYAGGDSVSTALQDRFQRVFALAVQECYGMTECVPICLNRKGRIVCGAIGELVDGMEVRIVDGDGREARPGETGELVVRSRANFTGYWKDPEATKAVLCADWLRTGDLVRRDEAGYYWFHGRKKQIIIRGGSNISPQEVEEALSKHPAVLEAGVIGVPDAVWGERVVAFVTLRNGSRPRSEDIIRFAQRRLADYKLPEKIVFLEALPKGPTGKVQRRELRERYLETNPTQESLVSRV